MKGDAANIAAITGDLCGVEGIKVALKDLLARWAQHRSDRRQDGAALLAGRRDGKCVCSTPGLAGIEDG
ncbi:MAG: hypothetical protein U5N85_03000 [Arcicella sp.]|nr:hypothetical protein [Arcicella sp.]